MPIAVAGAPRAQVRARLGAFTKVLACEAWQAGGQHVPGTHFMPEGTGHWAGVREETPVVACESSVVQCAVVRSKAHSHGHASPARDSMASRPLENGGIFVCKFSCLHV